MEPFLIDWDSTLQRSSGPVGPAVAVVVIWRVAVAEGVIGASVGVRVSVGCGVPDGIGVGVPGCVTSGALQAGSRTTSAMMSIAFLIPLPSAMQKS